MVLGRYCYVLKATLLVCIVIAVQFWSPIAATGKLLSHLLWFFFERSPIMRRFYWPLFTSAMRPRFTSIGCSACIPGKSYLDVQCITIGGGAYIYRWRPYRVECTGSLLTSEVKRRRARIVLGWGPPGETLGCCQLLQKGLRQAQQPRMYLEPKWLRCNIPLQNSRHIIPNTCNMPAVHWCSNDSFEPVSARSVSISDL